MRQFFQQLDAAAAAAARPRSTSQGPRNNLTDTLLQHPGLIAAVRGTPPGHANHVVDLSDDNISAVQREQLSQQVTSFLSNSSDAAAAERLIYFTDTVKVAHGWVVTALD